MTTKPAFRVEHDGRIILCEDCGSDSTHVPLSEPNEDGYRYVLHICCDCGTAHTIAVAADHLVFLRCETEEVRRVRQQVLDADPSYFPLRRLRPACDSEPVEANL